MDRAPIRNSLYPEIEPTRSGYLQVSALHRIYWEEAGRSDGIPVLFVHGGPGSGIGAVHRRFFDPGCYRVILFDQRGAGRSVPTAEIRENTTAHLIDDIETLRRFLNVDRWILFGGSWGSTLALAYGQRHPERCLGFVLRGIFLGRPSEIDWFMTGMGYFFPEAHRRFVGHLPEDERGDPLRAYVRRLNDPDPDIHGPAAEAWSSYEDICSTLHGSEDNDAMLPDREQMISLARLEAHYFENGIFLPENSLLDGMPRIADKPAVIVQGRYDVICPIRTADALAQAWPGADYVVVPCAGHSALETGIRMALIKAMETFKTRV